MIFDNLSVKDLDAYLKDLKAYRAQTKADFEAAQRAYFNSLSSTASIDIKEELHKKADLFASKLDKMDAAIYQIQQRLGAISSSHSIKSGTTLSGATIPTPFFTKFNAHADKILNLLKVQIIPSKVCVEPNDSIIKALFSTSGDTISVTEKHKSKRKPAVTCNLTVQGVALYNPLSEYDRAVLGVLISEQVFGNRYTTVNIIHRALIGKVGDKGAILRKNQESAIINSVSKLMGTVVDFSDTADSWKKLKYVDKEGNELILRKDNLLSASIFDAKINGQPVDGVIFFKENLPLLKIADSKDQIVRYPHELLNVPNQNNTPLVITLKKYVMRRICEIKLHKQLTPTITFDDVFSKCKVDSSDKKKKFDARNVITRFFEYLKVQNFISDFQVKKEGQAFSKISFSFGSQE